MVDIFIEMFDDICFGSLSDGSFEYIPTTDVLI